MSYFFSFDGIDGAGKSTQITLFCQWLAEQGRTVQQCRDPGSTWLGESLREIVLVPEQGAICRTSEMLLYMAARAQLVAEVVQPALAAGRTVVSDRFLLSNVVYQGHAGGLDVAQLWQIGQVATQGVMPDLTFVLDLPLDAAARRMQRSLDRMEQQGEEFRLRLRQGFLDEAARQPQKIAVIDASQPVEAVQTQIRQAAQRILDR